MNISAMTDKDCMTKEQPHEQHLLDLPCFDHDTSPPEQGHTVKRDKLQGISIRSRKAIIS